MLALKEQGIINIIEYREGIKMFKVKIAGMGKAVGSLKVKSEELEEKMNVTSGWIVKATGLDIMLILKMEKMR